MYLFTNFFPYIKEACVNKNCFLIKVKLLNFKNDKKLKKSNFTRIIVLKEIFLEFKCLKTFDVYEQRDSEKEKEEEILSTAREIHNRVSTIEGPKARRLIIKP